MTRKLLAKGKYEAYEEVFTDRVNEGVIELVPEEQLQAPAHYIPHRGVFKTASSTRVRPVFDASCEQKGMLSLNDCLEKGPNLLELIPAILLRFREEKIGVVSNIKKAFLQILVNEKDRDFLRFLWWEDRTCKRVKVMRHCHLVFGVNCSPFLLGAVLNYHLDESEEGLDKIYAKLRSSFYVDNCVTSVGTEEKLRQFIEHSVKLLSRAKFELRG
ncbi:uncharacterized protein [Halyomorpha halys]|uniref:uncharacterized protein n=1 Tax=Halyomorpha halys TaxID=286706 RepID=UPI0006D506FD|nr:uncharacterized protein LOC106684943 [Halyomorpha halys]